MRANRVRPKYPPAAQPLAHPKGGNSIPESIRKPIITILAALLLSLAPAAPAYASRPETSRDPDEQIIRFVSYGSIIGETVINHHFYLGADKNDVAALEPLLAAFTDRLYGLKTAFGKVTVRYEGTLDSIDPADFTELDLGWNGAPLEFEFSQARKIKYGGDGGIVTDIYLDITSDYEKPGMYSFSGKYKNVPYNLYIEVRPERGGRFADPADLTHLSVTYLPADEYEARPVSDISFHFAGTSQLFRFGDLRDVRLTNGGVDIHFNVHDYIVRHYVCGTSDADENDTETIFTVVFVDPLTEPGMYRVSGYYRDEPFSLSWTQLN